MPKEFDDMVKAIKDAVRKQHPNWKEDKISSHSYAIATDRWKKMHGGKMPMEKTKDWHILEFYVPIEESFLDNDDFMIKGVAINETTTLNNVKYVAEELEKAAVSFRNVPILLDHKNEVRNIVGRTTERVSFNPVGKRIDFEGKIMDKEIQEMIKDGRIGSVSIGAKVENLTEENDGSMKAIGIRGLEISLVAVPGDTGATLAHALENSFILKESANIENNLSSEKLNEQEIKMVEESTVVTPIAEETKIAVVEKVKEKTAIVDEKVSKEISDLKAQISELAGLLKEKKQIKEKAMEDKTVGEVSAKVEEELKSVDNRIVEALGKGNFAMYRNYAKESSDTNLKRLVR